jgi:pimeloyl-ACP methyl ester carboxylesterase
MLRRALPLLLFAVASLAMLGAARCYPANTRVVVFIQGIYTTYDDEGTQGTALEGHRFDTLKAAFVAKGYDPKKLLDFSYAGGTVTGDGDWQPSPYACELTDRSPAANIAPLEAMLRDYRQEHPNAHFALVGHSLGGYISFLAGARDAARADADKLGIDVVVTLDAPLLGVAADKKTILDLVPCEKTYLAGADLVAARLDAETPHVRRYQASVMAQEGVRLATLGNVNDCLYATAGCIGGDWVDDGATQFLPGAASISNGYDVTSDLLDSHDAILTHRPAIVDAVTFVGAP